MRRYQKLFMPSQAGLELEIKQILCYNTMKELHGCGGEFPFTRRFMQETQL